MPPPARVTVVLTCRLAPRREEAEGPLQRRPARRRGARARPAVPHDGQRLVRAYEGAWKLSTAIVLPTGIVHNYRRGRLGEEIGIAPPLVRGTAAGTAVGSRAGCAVGTGRQLYP